MTNETLEVIKRRRSIRQYRPKQIEDEELAAILEAGTWAPNGGGQAWHFTAIQNKAVIERLNTLAKQYAAGCGLPWLEELGGDEQFHSLCHAPTVVLVSGDAANVAAESDTAAACENLLLAAESLGVGSCWGYFATQAFLTEEGPALQRELQIPDGYKVYASVMLGYAAGEAPVAAERKPGVVTYIR